jgi:predicted acyltransferase
VRFHGHHLASLDAFRGLTVAGMILVNNPGNWSSVFESLTHADWNGCTLADLVFPFFIFILGAAMPFAFGRRVARGHQQRDLYLRIARRTAWLIALGLVLNAAAALPFTASLRIPGVLQRIGLVYLLTAPIVIHTGAASRAATVAALLLGHWALLTLVPFGGAVGGLTQSHNLAAFIDKAAFGRHILTATGDPEGILGTIPAVGNALLGSLAGEWLRRDQPASACVGGLVAGGLAAIGAGVIWAAALPLNKSLWTGSFVMFTGGVAALILTLCYVLLDVHDRRRWAQPFLWLGLNPLAVYFLSELVGHLLDQPWVRVAGHVTTPRSWLFWDLFRPSIPRIGDEWISLIFALLIVTFWTAFAGVLYRRDIRIQV